MNNTRKKARRRILGFKEWLKVTAKKQDAEKDKGQKRTQNLQTR